MNTDGTPDLYANVFVGPENNGQHHVISDDLHGDGYSAPIKCTTRLQDFTGEFGVVYAGRENCADVNDRSSVRLIAQKWVVTGSKYGFTCKGASHLDLEGEIEGTGKECEVDFGNYSDQCPKGDSTGRLNVWRKDRTTPIRVRCIQAEKPYLVPGSGPYVFVSPKPDAWYHGIAVWFFLFLRRNRIAFT